MRTGITLRGVLWCGVLWAASAASPLCAQIRVIPRTVLDSMANPPAAPGGKAMRFEQTTLDAGTMGEEDTPREFLFRWTNTGQKPLVVTHVSTTCGCAVANHDKAPVTAGGQGVVKVTYHPKGHPGKFSRRIFVYTQLSDKQPSATLTLAGTVNPSKLSAAGYSATLGALQVSRQSVTFDGTKSEAQQANITCRNAGDKPLRIGYDRNLLPPGFSLSCNPATLESGAQGTLTIRYEPQAGVAPLPRQFPLLLTGLGTPPSQSTIRIMIDNE